MPISLEFNEIYDPLFTTKARHIHFWGGRARGGSFTATQYFLHLITEPAYFRGYIMREVLGDIRESLWLDFKDRIEEANLGPYFELEESKMTAKYLPTGNTVVSKGFKKATKKQTAKLKSLAGATHVLIEEMEEISESDFKQLDDTLRTTKTQDIQLVGIFNPPPKGHWIWRKWYNLVDAQAGYFRAEPRKDLSLLSIFSTYRDNDSNLNSSFIHNLNQYLKDDPEYYYTMVEGLISEGVRGRIFRNWKPYTPMPNLYPKFYGLDWGFSGDPLALVELETHNRTIWVDQKIYAHGMTNDDLHEELKRLGISRTALITADNAQPKDIEDMRRKGWNFVPCVKGPGSVKSGVKFLKQYDIFVTETSADIWREYENYAYDLDQNKNPTDEPKDAFNHCFIGETQVITRYGLKRIDLINPMIDEVLTSNGFRTVLLKHDNGEKPVKKYSMLFDTFSVSLICTEDHKIKTQNGWIPISKLELGMMVSLFNFSMEENIPFMPDKDISSMPDGVCTGKYGNNSTGNALMDSIYITLMKTHGTIGSLIWNLGNLTSTYQSTAKEGSLKIGNGSRNFTPKESWQRKSGMALKRGLDGTRRPVKNHGSGGATLKLIVNSVGPSSNQEGQIANTVVETAVLRRFVQEEKGIQKVYDLSINETHEYFANGVLVHNCMDAINYGMDKVRVKKPTLRVI